MASRAVDDVGESSFEGAYGFAVGVAVDSSALEVTRATGW
jgi:hypothetical protein